MKTCYTPRQNSLGQMTVFFRLVSADNAILSNARSKTISNFVHFLNVLFNAEDCRYITEKEENDSLQNSFVQVVVT